MKFLIVIAVSLFLAGVMADMTPEVKAKLKKINDQCKASSDVTQETVDKARKGEIDEGDKQLGEFIMCYGLKTKAFKMEPIVNVEVIKKYMEMQKISKEDGEKALDECRKVDDKDPRLWANKFMKCMKSKVNLF